MVHSDPAASPRRSNPFGLASLIAGVLLLILSIAAQALTPVVASGPGVPLRTSMLIPPLLPAIMAAIATVLGIIGLLLRDRPRTAAIIGTTLGASLLVVRVVGIIGEELVKAVLGG